VSTSLKVHAGRCREERGASAVEFALVVPFLLLIVFGIIVYGMVFAQSLSLSNAARQAARAGVIEGTDCSDIKDQAHDAAGTMGMSGDAASVSIQRRTPTQASPTNACSGGDSTQPCQGQDDGTNIYVSLSYHPDPIVPFIPVPSQISGEGVYRCEFK
jgi:Flp pilus assembly protein TadG